MTQISNKTLLILGAGGHGSVVADAAVAAGYSLVVFADPQWPKIKKLGPWEIISDGLDIKALRENYETAVCGIGGNASLRLSQIDALRDAGFNLPAIVHPQATISPHTTIGDATVIFAGAVVNFGAKIGDGVIINTAASVDHDCILADGCHIAPGAHLGGDIKVGSCSWIGVGSAVSHGTKIGNNVTVGAGAAVVHDLSSQNTYVGVPARPLK